jgi:hypothetical protein
VRIITIALAFFALIAVRAGATEISLAVYGVVLPADMDPAAANWFNVQDPTVFRRMIAGTAIISVPDEVGASQQQAYARHAIYHAVLVPTTVKTGSTWKITAYRIRRVESVSDNDGSLTTTVNLDYGKPSDYLAFTSGATAFTTYALSAPNVYHVELSAGYIFPTAADGAAFRWTQSSLRMRGTSDASWLSGGGAHVAMLGSSVMSALSSYQGAYVQLRDETTGAYRYVRQNKIAHADASQYDPVLMDGDLLCGGSYYVTTPGAASCRYVLAGVQCLGSFKLTDAATISGLPSAIASEAAATELPAPPPTSAVAINTTHDRGVVPVVDRVGAATGDKVEFYHGGQTADQSTVRIIDDIDTVRAASASLTPVDNAPSGDSGDRINTPVIADGASGYSQNQAQERARDWNYFSTTTASGASAELDYGRRTDGTAAKQTIRSADVLAEHDRELNEQVTMRYDDHGAAIEPQKKPIILDASGTVAEAREEGDVEELYSKADVINKMMAPHMENTLWKGRQTPDHHGAMMYPIDYVDAWMISRYGDRTGITSADLSGDPIPGDGDNPSEPLPLGCNASHPFYDFDDDGDLDRYWSDDPFDGGYKKLKILWRQETGGTKQLGNFTVNPSYNIVAVGIKKPTKSDGGDWVANEDLLLHIGHSFRPFDHRKLSIHGYKTYYSAGLITPLDAFSSSDRALYQFALRNLVTIDTPDAGSDGASPEDMIPTIETALEEKQIDPDGDGIFETVTAQYTVAWYHGLSAYIDTPPWEWSWSVRDFGLPSAFADQPNVPAIFSESLRAADGALLSSRRVSRPVFLDPEDASVEPFDPAMIPVEDSPPDSHGPVANTYMWDYPQAASTAEGGTEPADPRRWKFPWNLAWKESSHSHRHTKQAFTLNSANMSYFPAYAAATPKITHEGLVAQANGPIRIQWIVRENPQESPSGDEQHWRDGRVLYTEPGWVAGMPWLEAGRAPFHVFDWDAHSDMYDEDRGLGGCLIASGLRVYDIVAGASEYYFRGRKYKPETRDEQLALLRRMWNYLFTGYEFPSSGTTTLPSLCIPQRTDNWDRDSARLNTAMIPDTDDDAVIVDRADRNRGGNAVGTIVSEMADPASASRAFRQATERRVKLMKEQVFLFSAARGREWELDMARRMPSSTRLICVEYDNKEDVKAIIGRDGGNVFFPEVRKTVLDDGSGGRREVETSNERDILKDLALTWFDSEAPYIGYKNGVMGANGDYTLKDTPASNDMSARTGSGNTIGAGVVDADYDGFSRHLAEGLPAGLAAYAYVLDSWPTFDPRQWAATSAQPLHRQFLIEFRHPMLIMYHDRASAIYVHYGRNADPDEVFGHWDDCAPPPPPIAANSPEFTRRLRFEAWKTTEELQRTYDQMHAAEYQSYLSSLVDLPLPPPEPGGEPIEPLQPPWPGNKPTQPVGSLRNWDDYKKPVTYTQMTSPPLPEALAGYSSTWAPWDGWSGYAGLTPEEQFNKYIAKVTKWDKSRNGFLRVYPANLDAAAVVGGSGVWTEQLARHGDHCYLIGYCVSKPPDTYNTGYNVDGWDTYKFYASSTPENLAGGTLRLTISSADDDALTPVANQQYYIDHRNDGNSPRDGRYYYYGAGKHMPGSNYFRPMNPEYYLGMRLKATKVAWYQAIFTQRAEVSARFESDYLRWKNESAAWERRKAVYEAWTADAATYAARHADWAAKKIAWDRWRDENAAIIALKEQARQYLEERASWISLVISEANQPGVSWTGDEVVGKDTAAEFREITPQLPIWEAYAWFVDPAHDIAAAVAGQ